jgi:hypothetical protein
MAGLIADEREKEGYELALQVQAALPMQVWRLDLEVERERPVTAAEDTVLTLVQAGITDVAELARAMGMGTDTRLPEQVLVKLLGAGAVDTLGSGFLVTAVGQAWRAAGSARGRERVAQEVRLDPVLDEFEWVDHERGVFGGDGTWTIELPDSPDEELLGRKTQIGDLVHARGLPDDELKAPGERRPTIELRGMAILSRRIHWREVRLDVWKHPLNGDMQIVGYIGDAENPPLTKLLSRHAMKESRRRVALKKSS